MIYECGCEFVFLTEYIFEVSEANLYNLICSFTASLTKERFILSMKREKKFYESKYHAVLSIFRWKIPFYRLSHFENDGKNHFKTLNFLNNFSTFPSIRQKVAVILSG